MTKVKFGDVDITKPHFLLTWRESYRDTQSIQIAVLSEPTNIDDVRLCLLTGDIKHEDAIKEVIQEVEYYLFELKNPDPIRYLADHHARNALANIYSNVRFTFVERISTDTIFYFLKLKAKKLKIYNSSFVYDLMQYYVNIAVDDVFDKALGNDKIECADKYNANLNHLYSLIYKDIPASNGFAMDNSIPIPKFSRLIDKMDINEYCNVLNYLRKMRQVTTEEARDLLRFYILNQKYNQQALSHS